MAWLMAPAWTSAHRTRPGGVGRPAASADVQPAGRSAFAPRAQRAPLPANGGAPVVVPAFMDASQASLFGWTGSNETSVFQMLLLGNTLQLVPGIGARGRAGTADAAPVGAPPGSLNAVAKATTAKMSARVRIIVTVP